MYNQIIHKLIYSRRQLKKIKHFCAGHIHIATAKLMPEPYRRGKQSLCCHQ